MTIIIGVLLCLCFLCSEDAGLACIGLVILVAGFLLNGDFRGWVVDYFTRKAKGQDNHATNSSRSGQQAHIDDWKAKRQAFEELKSSPIYSHWKRAQYNRQGGCCAWCGKKIALNSYYTHTDHIKPLWEGGTNDFSNLVLSCRDCNMRKGTSYEDGITKKADWIKDNIYEK